MYPVAVHAFHSLEVALKSNAADVPAFVHSPHVPVLAPVLAICTALVAQPVAWSLVAVPATGNVYPAAMHAFQLLEVALKSNAADVPPFVHSPHDPVLAPVLVICTALAAQPVAS